MCLNFFIQCFINLYFLCLINFFEYCIRHRINKWLQIKFKPKTRTSFQKAPFKCEKYQNLICGIKICKTF